MDSQALNAFITVVDTGSFSMAAERLYLTQPAVTKRIQGLESQLGVTLFYRHPKKLTLTEAGSIFLISARNILREIENSKTALSNIDQHISGELKVISSHHIGLHRLPMVIKKFLGDYPDVELKIEFMESERAYEKIIKNQADIAFLTLDTKFDTTANSAFHINKDAKEKPDALTEHLHWADPMNIVCGLDHPLALMKSIDLATLARHRAILPEKKTFTYSILAHLFNKESLQLTGTIPTNYLETIKMLVVTGLGWTVLPNTMIDEFVHVIRLEGVDIQRGLGVVSHKKHLLSNSANAFIEVSKQIWPN